MWAVRMKGQIIEGVILPLIILLLFLFPTYLMESFVAGMKVEKWVLVKSEEAENLANHFLLGGCTIFTHLLNSTSNCTGYCVVRVGIVNGTPVLVYFGNT